MSKVTRSAAASEAERARDGGAVATGEVRDDAGRILVWARRPFGYNGQDVDRGQVFGMAGARNDEKLVRLGYVLTVLKGDEQYPCRKCARKFIDLDTLNAHGHKRHAEERLDLPGDAFGRGFTVDETAAQVQAMEREERLLDQIAPLNLDKTTASRG